MQLLMSNTLNINTSHLKLILIVLVDLVKDDEDVIEISGKGSFHGLTLVSISVKKPLN